MKINSIPPDSNKTPNFGIAYKRFSRTEFKTLAQELEGRVGIHILKNPEYVEVVFATIPNSTDETYAIGKYGAEKIQSHQAKDILGHAILIVTENFGKLKSAATKPLVDTRQGLTPYTKKPPISKLRIDYLLNTKGK